MAIKQREQNRGERGRISGREREREREEWLTLIKDKGRKRCR